MLSGHVVYLASRVVDSAFILLSAHPYSYLLATLKQSSMNFIGKPSEVIIYCNVTSSTYDHRVLRPGLPIRFDEVRSLPCS